MVKTDSRILRRQQFLMRLYVLTLVLILVLSLAALLRTPIAKTYASDPMKTAAVCADGA